MAPPKPFSTLRRIYLIVIVSSVAPHSFPSASCSIDPTLDCIIEKCVPFSSSISCNYRRNPYTYLVMFTCLWLFFFFFFADLQIKFVVNTSFAAADVFLLIQIQIMLVYF